jgi:hypothetical protein
MTQSPESTPAAEARYTAIPPKGDESWAAPAAPDGDEPWVAPTAAPDGDEPWVAPTAVPEGDEPSVAPTAAEATVAEDGPTSETAAELSVAHSPVTARLGIAALGLAILFLVADIVAIALAAGRVWPVATTIAQVTLVLTIVSFVMGLVAVLSDRGRRSGAVAIGVSVFANPWVLLALFGFLGGS